MPTSQVVVAAGVIPLQRRVVIFIVRISVARLLICLSCSLDRMYQCDPMLSVFLCLISVSITPSRSIHGVTDGKISFFTMAE